MSRIYLMLISVVLILVSCSKSDPIETVEGEVNIYLVKSFAENTESDVVDATSVVLEDEPFLRYDDIVSYNSKEHVFKIKDTKKDLFKIEGNTVHFRAFAVVANEETIYTGFFWPMYSSQIMNWVVIEPLMAETSGELHVNLGYPSGIADDDIPDSRNDSRIVNIFKRDNKLID